MTPLRQPLPVHGHTPGLLCRGMPMRWPKWVVASGDPRSTYVVIDPSDPAHRSSTVDWSSPLALYAALHWLTGRGHRCLWMLPESHGGKVEPWDGLSAWEVSAILVSASVLRVAEGAGPVGDMFNDWRDNGDAHERRSVRYDHARHEAVILCAKDGRRLWSGYGWDIFGEFRPCGPETGAAGMTAADGAALSDGAALLVEGGVAVLAPGAP